MNNEVKLNLISQILQQGERIIGEYIRKPVCRILLDHIFRMKNYQPISSWQSKDTLFSISPYIECLEPQMLPEKEKYGNWVQLFSYIAVSHEIDPATCLQLLHKLDSHSWSRITSETKFLCLRFAPPQIAVNLLWHWEQKYETELALNGIMVSMQDMALQNTLKREKLVDLSLVKRNEDLFQLVTSVYLHLLNYEETQSLYGMYYVALKWNKIPITSVQKLDPRSLKQTQEYIKDHRLSPQSQWSEKDLQTLGALVTGLSADEITQNHLKYFFKQGNEFIKHLSVPTIVKLISLIRKELPRISDGLRLANIREYDMGMLNYLSAHDLQKIIQSTFESGYYSYNSAQDRIEERLPTELLNKKWDTRISCIIYDNVMQTIGDSLPPDELNENRVALTGPMSESIGPILLGANYKDFLDVRYSEWLSVINSFQFFLDKNQIMSRGLAQTLATYFHKVSNDLFGPNKASERHMEPSFRIEVHLLGGRVLREVDPKFFFNVPAYLCREAVSMIGELKDNIMLPRKMRQQIVAVYLNHCRRSPELDFVDLVSLGSLICDIPAEFLRTRANQTLLRERVHYFKQCSLSRLQGEVIKNLLPKPVMSYENILNLQSAMCSFMNAKDLMLLNDTAKTDLVPAMPFIWKQQPELFSNKIRYSKLLWDPEMAFLEGLDLQSQQQLGSCIRTTAWVYATDFKHEHSYYYQKDCAPDHIAATNTLKKDKDSPITVLTCAELKDLGAGIAVLPQEYFEKLNPCQLKRCIFYLTTHPYVQDSTKQKLLKLMELAIQKQHATNDSLATFATWSRSLLWYDLPVLTSFMSPKEYHLLPTESDFLYLVQTTLPGETTTTYQLLEYLFSRYLNLLNRKQLTVTEVSTLGNILCGSTIKSFSDRVMFTTKTTIASILPDDFRSSLHLLGNLSACSSAQFAELAKFYESSYTGSEPHSRVDIIDLNLIMSTASETLLNSLERDQLKMINCETIRRIPEDTFKQLGQLFFLRLSPEQIRCFTPAQWKHVKQYKLRIVNNNLCSQFKFSDSVFTCLVTGNEFKGSYNDADDSDQDTLPDYEVEPFGQTDEQITEFDVEGAIDSSITVQSHYPLTDLHYVTVGAHGLSANFVNIFIIYCTLFFLLS